MDDSLKSAVFDEATVFEAGYLFGFRQVEVANLRFRSLSTRTGGEYTAAVFVERGKRKEQAVPLDHVVVLAGWDHPRLETSTIEDSGDSVAHRAKFPLFSPGWDLLLDEYLLSNNLGPSLVIDGRDRENSIPTARPAASALQPAAPPTDGVGESVATGGPQALIEGSVETLLLDRFERDPRARAICLERYGYRCQGCQVLLSEVYGALGEKYIHVHHRVRLADARQEHVVDPVRDLVPVCPNCHAIIHRSVPPLPVEELADLVRRARREAAQQAVAALVDSSLVDSSRRK